jgi:tRNA A58 N-methylase Trm61
MSDVASVFGMSISKGGESETAVRRSTKPQTRADSLVAVTSSLGVNAGSVIADIGAGSGRDSWVFARVVGASGRILAEEITPGMVDSLKKESETKGLKHVCPILGACPTNGSWKT